MLEILGVEPLAETTAVSHTEAIHGLVMDSCTSVNPDRLRVHELVHTEPAKFSTISARFKSVARALALALAPQALPDPRGGCNPHRPHEDGMVHHPAIDLHGRSPGCLHPGNHPVRPVSPFFRRSHEVMDELDLLGMDAQLRAKPEPPRAEGCTASIMVAERPG